MGKEKQLSDFERGLITALFNENKSISSISQKTGRSRKVISSYLKMGDAYGKTPRSGRPCLVSPRKKKAIIREARGKVITANQLRAKLTVKASADTILRILHKDGKFKRKKLMRKPLLTPEHKLRRVSFAREYISLGDKWKYVIFSDEKKFNLDGPDGYGYYWHALGDSTPTLLSRTFGGGSVMVWACFDHFGQSEIVFIDGSIDSARYQDALSEHLLPFLASRNNESSLFQQDNARPHVSRSTLSWLNEHGVKTLPWPAYSPDLNPIENLWGILVQRVYANGRQFQTINELKQSIILEWRGLEPGILQSLSLSMTSRMCDVLQGNGSFIKY